MLRLPRSWALVAVAVLAVIVVSGSAFFAWVGVPYDTSSCGASNGGPTSCSGPGTMLVPVGQALVGVVGAGVVLAGLATGRLALAWAGTTVLVVFGVLSLASLGMFYLVPSLAMLSLLEIHRGGSSAGEPAAG